MSTNVVYIDIGAVCAATIDDDCLHSPERNHYHLIRLNTWQIETAHSKRSLRRSMAMVATSENVSHPHAGLHALIQQLGDELYLVLRYEHKYWSALSVM